MIIKGASRAAPDQLARHLQRRDTNERIEIIELQSPASGLRDAFRDWQTLSEGTRGFKGLYHANIDPAADYVMTPEQWKRAVEVLEKELGFEGQPRAVVMHEKHGRQHIHVVWARTDIDSMTLCPDGYNYVAHERASKALELEFGHEPVPGKHAKRDREKQPDFPNSEMNQAEWQQGERSGLDPRKRKEQITALHAASDNAQAFKAALEDAGYVLAKGDRRDFVIIDQAGDIHSLGRQIKGVKATDLREFMKGIDRESLPTIGQAQSIQEARRQAPEQPAVESPQPPPDAELEALKKAWAEREATEARKRADFHASELQRKEFELETLNRQNADAFASQQFHEKEALRDRYRKETSGLRGFIAAVQSRWNPELGAWKAEQRRREFAQFERRQQQERKDYLALLEQTKQLEIENLKERQAMHSQDRETRAHEDLERHVRELETSRRLLAETEEREKQREQERKRDGPDRPPPTRAR